MCRIAAARGLTFLGLDVHRDTISVAVLGPGREEAPTVDRIANDEPSIRRLVGRFGDPRRLRACYEAGPTGYELARLLHRMDVRCQVIAPALIPKAPGDKIKTDSRDCRRLARGSGRSGSVAGSGRIGGASAGPRFLVVREAGTGHDRPGLTAARG